LPAYARLPAQTISASMRCILAVFFSSHSGYTNPNGRMHVKEGLLSASMPATGARRRSMRPSTSASLDMGDAPWNSKMLNSFRRDHYPTAHFVSTRAWKDRRSHRRRAWQADLLDKTRRSTSGDIQPRGGEMAILLQYVAGFSATATFKRSLFA
jgi:hypothetical protein